MIKKFLPANLLGRAMLIVIFPILTFQIIMLTYYFNSLWERTLSRLARSVAAEVSMIVDQVEQNNLSKNQIENGQPTIPSTIRDELDCNIFLRAKDLKSFSKLRDLKDKF